MSGWDVVCGDCLDVMRGMEPESVDAVVTDPPAAIAFMGRDWDHDKGGREEWIAWLASVLREACRVMKPGAHAFVWALPRTSGWTHRAIEDAGLEVRDVVTAITGQGFPKSLDVGKALDRMAGAGREIVGTKMGQPGYSLADNGRTNKVYGNLHDPMSECAITAPATPRPEYIPPIERGPSTTRRRPGRRTWIRRPWLGR